ncbi:winged helix family transcriptional regulator [Ruminococcus sp. AF27-12AA]|nr:winged helix family transcriptional regulator [Ruminococcus sp. AF27-3]RGG10948.1 winged helix family transcriptional regulator [Ruminococcus sp. AF27-11AA]RGG11109.1 winged helix family transcriptional regulator [Ruminococcus sp. AF27-12AA]
MVKKNNQEVELTYTEFEILYLLSSSPGRVFSKEQIYDLVWEESYSGDYNIVMSHIHNIREKIEDTPNNPVYIQTVWGVGYKFNEKLKETDIMSHYANACNI